MSVQQQSNSTTLQLVQLSTEEFSEIIAKQVSAELRKLLPHLQKSIDSSVNKRKLYTRQEAAGILCVSLTTLHNWKVNGILVPLQSGRKCLYTAEQLESYLNRGQADELPF